MLASDVLAMDETSLKAGREAKGKMRTGWLWPVYGDADEVVFHYAPLARAPSRACLSRQLPRHAAQRRLRRRTRPMPRNAPREVTHALCWSHTRRHFERAKDSEPEAVAEALALIGAMYAHEK